MDNLSIRARVNRNKMLLDLRQGRRGLLIGTVESVAAQYGITITESDGYTIFTAPRKRLQMMAEKLHFAGIKYR